MVEKIFLLGGFDLEMLTIRALLEKHSIRYHYKKLNWANASLSQYAEELKRYAHNEEVVVYGVELQERGVADIPANYIRIDHHNDYSHLPSSLEQIAALLGVQLDYEQQLIAANDKGYIPAMQALGAGKDEIQRIRLLDRKAQGVTEKEEQLAVRAIKNRRIEQGVVVVKSETNRFSPICDRLFPYDRLLVYTDDELMYYGKGTNRLSEYFEAEIDAGRMFYGGGSEGFIGTKQGEFSKEELTGLKDKIIHLVSLGV